MNVLKRLTGLFAVSVVSFSTYAQDVDDFLKTEYIKDSEKVIGAYISPLMKSASVGLNQGWYNTAKTHKIVGFDLTISVSALNVPNDEMSFNPNKLGLKNIELSQDSPGYPNAPTIFGKDQKPEFRDVNTGETFSGPPGIGLKDEIGRNLMPMPIAHLGIGLPKGTDLKLRFVPTIDLNGEGEFKLFGLGVMHDIKQWIPGLKLMPFDLAGFVGYSQMDLTLKHESDLENANAHSDIKMSATTIQGVISKKFSVITFYGGLGYNISKSKIGVKGKYDVDDDGVADIVNPVNLKFGASGPRMTAGFRLKLAILTLHADYTLQKYSALTAGIGFAVR